MTTNEFRRKAKELLEKWNKDDIDDIEEEYTKLLSKLDNRWLAGYLQADKDNFDDCHGIENEISNFDQYNQVFWTLK